METIRVFAQEHLNAEAAEEACRRHATYYAEKLERGENCREERDNLRAAAAWFTRQEDRQAHLRFIASFRVYHWEEGFSENIDHCKPALAHANDSRLPEQLRGRALAAYAMVAERVEQGEAETFRRAAELLAHSNKDEPLRAFMLQYGGTPECREQAEQVARRARDDRTLHWVLTIRGNHASYRGDWECAEQYWTEALTAAVRTENPVHTGFVRSEWSFYLLRRGEYVRSLALLQQNADCERKGHLHYPRLLMALGRYDRARSTAQRNVEHHERLGATRLIQSGLFFLATALLCLGDVETARKICAKAETLGGTPQYRLQSEIALAAGEMEAAVHFARGGLALASPHVQDFHSGGDRIGLLEAQARAEASCEGREKEAWEALLESMELRFRFGVRLQQCENLETAAFLQAREGRFAAAALSLRASEEARLEYSNPCLPFLRRFAADARLLIPPAVLAAAPCLPLDAAIEIVLEQPSI